MAEESTSEKSDMWLTRQTLLLRIKDRNDENAWYDFESYYRRYLYNILRYMNIGPSDSKDISQLVLLIMWKKLPEFTHDSSKGRFRSWLAKVVKNQAINFLIKKQRHSHQELPPGKFPASQNELEKIIDSEWQRTIIEQAWEVVKMEFEESTIAAFELSSSGMSTAEIAEKLGIAESSVYSFKSRVKSRLKKEVHKLNNEFG